ncbi:peptidase M56 [Candidatus Parcubacteria bacterium]|nr:peptidase M56 [Candidatus Parcubacteria bacterium]
MQEERTLPIHLALLFIVLLFVGVIVYARHVTNTRADNPVVKVSPTKFTTYVYKVSLEYPADWQPTPGYNYDHYNGETGFFGLSAAGDAKTTLDSLAKSDAEHVLRPYGSSPKVETLTVDGEPARIILPSLDQDPEEHRQAELIVKYPKPVEISSTVYHYFILWADEDHIRNIVKTLKFI